MKRDCRKLVKLFAAVLFYEEKSGHCVSNYTKPLKVIKNLHNKVEGGLNCHPHFLFIQFLIELRSFFVE